MPRRSCKPFTSIVACCVIATAFFACKNNLPGEDKRTADTTLTAIQSDSSVNDSAALVLSQEILEAVKNKNYAKLVTFLNDSLRFSPYGFVNKAQDRNISKWSLLTYLTRDSSATLYWGRYDGTGDRILLTAAAYFQKFVYDVDFLNAPQVSLNKSLSQGNSIDNLHDIYKNAVYTEFYFPGFKEEYGGMDWRSLKLVFQKAAGRLYLVGIIHNQWTS